MQDLPTGWVGQRRQEEWSGESAERKKKHIIHLLCCLAEQTDRETHSRPLRSSDCSSRGTDEASTCQGRGGPQDPPR